MTTTQTLFIFGRTPDLSFLELSSFFPQATRIGEHAAYINELVDPVHFMNILGGTVKIAHGTEGSSLTSDILVSILLKEAKDKRITFGLSTYGVRLPDDIEATLKNHLTRHGLHVRYVEDKHGEALGSVVVAKQRVSEIALISDGRKMMIGITRAVQDFEKWNRRDFGRPAVDPKSGMLPPKVARMIVNISLGKQTQYHPTLLDPFCGSGTILAEGLLRGANVIGTDMSTKAIEKTKKNLDWLRHEYPEIQPLYANVFAADATHIGEKITPSSIDAIVTEPDMGEVVEGNEKNTLKGLEKLYIGSLREWYTLLKPGAKIVMAMPAYVTRRGVMRVKNIIDRCEILGYTLLTGPIEYSRPQAIVRREFFVFQKK